MKMLFVYVTNKTSASVLWLRKSQSEQLVWNSSFIISVIVICTTASLMRLYLRLCTAYNLYNWDRHFYRVSQYVARIHTMQIMFFHLNNAPICRWCKEAWKWKCVQSGRSQQQRANTFKGAEGVALRLRGCLINGAYIPERRAFFCLAKVETAWELTCFKVLRGTLAVRSVWLTRLSCLAWVTAEQ